MKHHILNNPACTAFMRRITSAFEEMSLRLLLRFCCWTSFVMAMTLCQPPEQARAQSTSPSDTAQWSGIQRLQVHLASHEAAPFIAWNTPDLSASDESLTSTQAKPSLQQTQQAPQKGISPLTHETTTEASLDNHRNQLRDTLVRDGQSSLESRDSLTHEALNVMKWTIVTLVLGGVAVTGLKKISFQKAGESSSQRIRVLETLSLGRQQGLKLVEVGGERFLIASDQGGIKNVTLLPSWPAMDQLEPEPASIDSSPGSRSLFESTLQAAAS